MKMTLQEIAQCLRSTTSSEPESGTSHENSIERGTLLAHGLLESPTISLSTICKKACIDSREVTQGSLFFCLRGERSDGHSFAQYATAQGAVAVVAEKDPFAKERALGKGYIPVVFLVDDSEKALWKLAKIQRKKTTAKVIGITGSAGKTTMKESLAYILSGVGKTEKNFKNLNTQIGLSLSIINADEKAEYWVMEVGISKPHDMDELGAILQPDVAVVMNVANAHAEGLGEKGVAWHKANLLKYITKNGQAVVSADYADLRTTSMEVLKASSERNIAVHTFSAQSDKCFSHAEFASIEKVSGHLVGSFTCSVNDQKVTLLAPFLGSYGSENVAALAALCVVLEIPQQIFIERLVTVKLPDQRFSLQSIGASIVIDDSYNANPLSAKRMIEATSAIAAFEKKKVMLVMGEMLELGKKAYELHTALAKDMVKSGTDVIFWKGGQKEAIQVGLSEAGYSGKFFTPQSESEFLQEMKDAIVGGYVILFKGSRSIRLEEWFTICLSILENRGK